MLPLQIWKREHAFRDYPVHPAPLLFPEEMKLGELAILFDAFQSELLFEAGFLK
jgi:hypothetical protein